jgi:putative ABC transport system permease protein
MQIKGLTDDVKVAVRQLKGSPGFTLVAAITLALGIGANSAMFALVDATLLRPLPFGDPGRLVMLTERSPAGQRSFTSPLNMLDWNERSRAFDVIAGYAPGVGGMVMAGADGTAETVSRQWVTPGFFEALGVTPLVGRTFTRADEAEKRLNLVVLGEGLWRTRFGSDPGVVGRDIRFDGDPFTVVGVVPKEFQLRGQASMWAMRAVPRRPQLRSVYMLQTIGRLKPGVSLEAARADMAAVSEALGHEFPATNKGRSVTLEPLQSALMGTDLRTTSLLFLGVVGFVLLICCANVANLLLARATVRTRELAVRSALGAGRSRLIRQLLVESLLLAVTGGLLGLGVGAAILRIAPSIVPDGLLPAAITLGFDMRIVAFCAVTALLVGLIFGLAPAWQSTQVSSTQVMASESRSVTGHGGRLRNLLVVSQVAIAVVLLFGGGLLLRTLVAVETADRGYREEQVLTMLVDPLGTRYPTPALLNGFFEAVEQEVRAVPGVGSVAWTSGVPLGDSVFDRVFFDVVGDQPVEARQRAAARYQTVSPGYFQTVDLPVVAGRTFSDRDTPESVPVCIVNEAFVRGHLRGRSPIGLRVALRGAESEKEPSVIREIVGVTRHVRMQPDELEEAAHIYVPMVQDPVDDIYLAVRPKSGRAEALTPSVRAAIARVDKEQLVSVREVATLEDIAWGATGRHRFRAVLLMTFAGLSLVLAMVGVFGILAYSVQQRVRDFGVRRALGATTNDIVRLVAWSAIRVIAAGAALGLALAVMLGRLMATMLYGVQPLDPVTFSAVMAVLVVTASLSIAGPAWRAVRIDPAHALRGE